MSQKFFEVAKTLRYFIILVIVCVAGYVTYSIFNSPAEKKISMNIEALRLAKCQEIVIAKGTANVKAEITERQKLAGITLPSFAPGSKSVKYDGPVVMRFGYDSLTPLFPANTQFLRDGNSYQIIIDQVTYPKVLTDPAIKGYAHESTSYFTGDIPAEEFFQYLDSLTVVAGNRTIKAHPNYFRDAYIRMAFETVRSIIGNDAHFTITIGDLTFNEMQGGGGNPEESRFIENIESLKEL